MRRTSSRSSRSRPASRNSDDAAADSAAAKAGGGGKRQRTSRTSPPSSTAAPTPSPPLLSSAASSSASSASSAAPPASFSSSSSSSSAASTSTSAAPPASSASSSSSSRSSPVGTRRKVQVQAHEEHEAKQAERLVDEDPIISVDKGVPRVMTFDYWMSQWDRKKKKHRKQTNGLIHAMKQYNEFIKGNYNAKCFFDMNHGYGTRKNRNQIRRFAGGAGGSSRQRSRGSSDGDE